MIETRPALICRVLALSCALPLEVVIETMRPLPVEAVSGMPRFVLGISIIRGAPVIVVDAGLLLGDHPSTARRAVTVRTASRTIALLVDQVIGVRTLTAQSLAALPPLLAHTASDAITAIAALDDELVLMLRGAKLVPDDLPTGGALEGTGA
jgi:purine-binding chemotaxis protein CheW